MVKLLLTMAYIHTIVVMRFMMLLESLMMVTAMLPTYFISYLMLPLILSKSPPSSSSSFSPSLSQPPSASKSS